MKRVLVAMSGGVDSSVAAALLLKQGYFVAGAYMKNFSEESWRGVVKTDCPWQRDVADAKTVCRLLKIPFQSINFEKEYRREVIEYFFAEYKAGRTPNPDIMCNQKIKFGLFLKKAMELGFDHIATGHYAKIQKLKIKMKSGNSKFKIVRSLLKGTDPKKDQSYFLYRLTQNQLEHCLFPIGDYTKVEVRKLAKKFGLPNADKKDSQGVCFIGHINLRKFLEQRIKSRKGRIVDTKGNILGSHPGVWYYTIGQREGLGIGGGGPYYVIGKNLRKNLLVVAKNGSKEVYSKKIKITKIHWIDPLFHLPLAKGKKARMCAKIRYQQPDQPCIISAPRPLPARPCLAGRQAAGGRERMPEGQVRGLTVKFAAPQFAPAPGQSIVFYDNNTCLGGGIIA